MEIKCAEPKSKPGEVWKAVPGYEERYHVSNLGRVASILKYDINFGWKSKWEIISPRLHDSYCHVVNLWRGNKFKTFRVHRLVCMAFLINLENKKTVNHKDGNRLNNNLSNLEWATQAENNRHSYDVLKRTGSFLGKTGIKHHRSKPVARFCDGKIIEKFESARQASITHGLVETAVANSARKGSKAGGMNWIYI